MTNTGQPDPAAMIAARERILRLVGAKPLSWSELQNALGLLTNEARLACEWLMDHSYIAPMRMMRARSVEAVWTLGDRGLAWAKRNGALRAEGAAPFGASFR
jgi:hypothetical protein